MSAMTITDRQTEKNRKRIERERLAFAASCNDGLDAVNKACAFVASYRMELASGSIGGLALFIVGSYLGMF